ncbi:hypothetical protein EUTSA_v10027963mg [Eutrema salsugineum]|uniref:UBN2 domain-containing protein n=1 Tax=Eutrema salsugineum TaxID=72664 RepID=V4LUA1_EUTSA|nr:hypothetical protein EUTSA_v10027963mg [Eutrema salsugineum]
MARDLWDIVESGVSEENTNQSLEESAKRTKDLRIKDMTALHMLQMSVTDSVFFLIARATSSNQAWEILKAGFGETEEFKRRKRGDLVGEYFNMVMKEEDSFDEFIEKFMKLVNRSKFYGNDISDQELISRIFCRLPSRFDQARINIPHVEYEFKKREEALQNHKNSKNKRGRRYR